MILDVTKFKEPGFPFANIWVLSPFAVRGITKQAEVFQVRKGAERQPRTTDEKYIGVAKDVVQYEAT